MKDFWDNLAQLFGYDYWDWNIAAGWFAAVGTVGAFFLGLGILWYDRIKTERKLADGLYVWADFFLFVDQATVNVHVLNSNAVHIPVVRVKTTDNSADRVYHLFNGDRLPSSEGESPIVVASVSFAVDPGQVLSQSFPVGHLMEDSLWFAEIRDSRGRVWYRNIMNGRYMSLSELYKINSASVEKIRAVNKRVLRGSKWR